MSVLIMIVSVLVFAYSIAKIDLNPDFSLFLRGISFFLSLSGIALYLFGLDIVKKMGLGLWVLLFMIPLPWSFYEGITIPLQGFVTRCTAWLFDLCGMSFFYLGL